MPGLNRKGPEGKGAMTGRGMGLCNPENQNLKKKDNTNSNDTSQDNFRGMDLRRGRRLGRGFGFRNRGE